ncbi:MAG TPA: hypothetical protein VFO93_16805 [Hymenobacter sp.]|uniref:hypothetical protein n=1 Tax=Hymenobacter sp. TaxID=1898978 RepID=UPI002D7E9EC6|nr:hypothetical protein [Hymenobacter sp.]HET9505206.1 hypothetical protein [Hymenobacter sp.]
METLRLTTFFGQWVFTIAVVQPLAKLGNTLPLGGFSGGSGWPDADAGHSFQQFQYKHGIFVREFYFNQRDWRVYLYATAKQQIISHGIDCIKANKNA